MSRHLGIPFLVVSGLLALGGAALAGGVNGNVFFTTEEIKDQSHKALSGMFAKEKPASALKRKKDGDWEVIMVAFFARTAAAGPITYWVYDKEDKASIKHNDPISLKSVDRAKGEKFFIYNLVLDEDFGFNKCHSYLVMVGQIINGKNKVYAKGEVTLDPDDPRCQEKAKAPAPAPAPGK